LYSELEDS